MKLINDHLHLGQIAHGHALRHFQDNHGRVDPVPVHNLVKFIQIRFIVKKDSGLVDGDRPHLIPLPGPVRNFFARLLQHIHIQFRDESIFLKHRYKLIGVVNRAVGPVPADQGLRAVKRLVV